MGLYPYGYIKNMNFNSQLLLGFLVFLLLGIGFVILTFIINMLVRQKSEDPEKFTIYECGMEAIGTSWRNINIRFYIFCLIFVLFDVEVLYLFPWAENFKNLGLLGFFEMIIFLVIIFFGLFYVWKKKCLEWE